MSGSDARVVFFPFVGGEGQVGGSHISAIKLAYALQASPRYRAHLGVHRPGGPLAELIAAYGLESELLPVRGIVDRHRFRSRFEQQRLFVRDSLQYAAQTLPDMTRFLRHRAVSIVHTNDGRMHVNWAPAAALTRTKLVWHHRGDPSALGVNLLAPLLADRVVTVSQFARPARPVFPVAPRVRVIHSPFDPPDIVDREAAGRTLRAELGLGPEARLIGTVGTLVARKRPADIVEVVAELRRSAPEVPVVGLIFGEPLPGGPRLDESVSRLAAERGVSDSIRLMGFRKPIEPLIAALDVLCVTSVGEPFGRSLIEAMQLGTPVVAYRDGGNREAIESGRTGYLADVGCPQSLAGSVLSLLRDADHHAGIARAARAHALSAFSTRRHVAEISELYDEFFEGSMTLSGK